MEIIIAEKAGYCFGVKRALEIINNLYHEGKRIQIFGPLIHNHKVMRELTAKGIESIQSIDQVKSDKVIVIRTHGIPLTCEQSLKEKGIFYIDATCPLVKKTHEIIKEQHNLGKHVVIIGDKDHPEIVAAKSYAEKVTVIGSIEEAEAFSEKQELSVVAQTTLDQGVFKKILSVLIDKVSKVTIFNTICHATRERQEAIEKIAPMVDVVIVIGGKHSSNTKKLFQLAKQKNDHTFFIENVDDLDTLSLKPKGCRLGKIGITAGASTPVEEIIRVKKKLQRKIKTQGDNNGKGQGFC